MTTVLVTGANRGIGRGFTQTYLLRPSTTVIAAVRDLSNPTSQSLADLPKGDGSRLILVKLDGAIDSDAADAVKKLKNDHGISSLDTVIANAGIGAGGGTVRKTSAANMTEHHQVNTIAPILLFQATVDLLQASKNPKFIAISTIIGSIGAIDFIASLGMPKTASPYGGSKAALNWFVRRLHFEEPWLTSFVFHPGLVDTDMVGKTFEGTGLKHEDVGIISVDTSVAGMTKTIDAATREIGGTFQNYDGITHPW